MSNSKKPVSKVQLYPITAAIWRNENAKGEAFYNVTFERAYKSTDGYQSSSSFSTSDLLLLAKVANMAHSEIFKLRAKDHKAQSED